MNVLGDGAGLPPLLLRPVDGVVLGTPQRVLEHPPGLVQVGVEAGHPVLVLECARPPVLGAVGALDLVEGGRGVDLDEPVVVDKAGGARLGLVRGRATGAGLVEQGLDLTVGRLVVEAHGPGLTQDGLLGVGGEGPACQGALDEQAQDLQVLELAAAAQLLDVGLAVLHQNAAQQRVVLDQPERLVPELGIGLLALGPTAATLDGLLHEVRGDAGIELVVVEQRGLTHHPEEGVDLFEIPRLHYAPTDSEPRFYLPRTLGSMRPGDPDFAHRPQRLS